MAFEITNSFLEEFDAMFYPFLQQQGSQLMQAVTQKQITGEMQYIRQQDVGEAHFVSDLGGITEYTPIRYDKRRLKPRAFECPIILNDYLMVQQGTPDPTQLAQQAANSCGKLLDRIIIDGLGGKSYTEASGVKTLSGADKVKDGDSAAKVVAEYDKTQTIAWNDCTLGAVINDNTASVKAGLSTAKINKAVQKLRSKFNYGPIFCVTSSYGATSGRADKRMASSEFNDIHAFMQGINNPYAGVDAFIISELVDGGKSKVNANGVYSENDGEDVEYAYIFSMNQVVLGTSMPIHMKNGINAERQMGETIVYRGMYDCTRLFEESVVRIEINKRPPKDEDSIWAK